MLYLSDDAQSSNVEERIIRLEPREALIWLNETAEDGGTFLESRSVADIHKITDFSISTTMTNPLRGIVEIETPETVIKFELSEGIAHSVCVLLERFLTQERQPKASKARLSQ
jgi:hypothetical protein